MMILSFTGAFKLGNADAFGVNFTSDEVGTIDDCNLSVKTLFVFLLLQK